MTGLRIAIAFVALGAIVAQSVWFRTHSVKYPIERRLTSLVFPASEIALLGFLYAITVFYDVSWALFAPVVVANALCLAVNFVLRKALDVADGRERAAAQARVLEEQELAQADYVARLAEEDREAREVHAGMAEGLRRLERALACEGADTSVALAEARAFANLMPPVHCGLCRHRVVDVVASAKAERCERAGIEVEFSLDVPEGVSIPDVDLCALFSNLLDNAINACAEAPSDQRFVRMKAGVAAGYMVVKLENGCAEMPAKSRKRRGRKQGHFAEHGWGLIIVRDIAERFDGELSTEQDGAVFRTAVTLVLPAGRAEG